MKQKKRNKINIDRSSLWNPMWKNELKRGDDQEEIN
jgi:hypothetical protein